MKVLHVTHQYRPAVGGAEKYIIDLSEELARRGHTVDVFTSRSTDYMTWRNTLPRSDQIEGVSVYRYASLERAGWVWETLRRGYDGWFRTRRARYQPLIFVGNGPVCPGLFWAILRSARAYDVMHINNLHYAHAATAFWAARWRGLPVVITPHVHAEQGVTYDVAYMLNVLRGSDQIITDTWAEKQFLICLGYDSQQITVGGTGLRLAQVPQCVPLECRRKLGLPETGFVLLFLSRKTEYKGLDTCLEAFAALRARRSDVYFAAVGPDTDFSRQCLARYTGIEGLIARGEVSDDDKWNWLWACDALALPSAAEAFGIVYLEAWAAGKPVVGARIASVSSLIADGADGCLIAPGDAGELVVCVERWADSPELARQMGAQGRAKLEARYTVPRIADIAEGAYVRAARRAQRHNS